MAFLLLLSVFCFGHSEANGVTPSTEHTVSASAWSHISPGVSRMISTRNSVPSTPFDLEGHTSGTNGVLLSWTMADAKYTDFIIRYREVCPYPATDFTEENRFLDSPVVLLTELISGSTYQFQVAAVSSGIAGAFSKSLYIKTAESPPGLVTNLTAFAQNHSYVVVTWFLPQRINGLITKFSVNVKHARNGMVVRRLSVNAEDIMSISPPHCNDAADILSRATVSPLEMTASSPPVTLSAVPPAALWKMPITVGVDQLRPFTPYLFEVSAFTSEGEGKTGSVMVHMPEAAPEGPPLNLTIQNKTSRYILLSWMSPRVVTGKFSYVLDLYGPAGSFLNGSTFDTNYEFSGLIPYTSYTVVVRAKSAGELGPATERQLLTAAEAPSAVRNLAAEALDSLTIRVSWKSPAQPNGPVTQYRLQVLVRLVQDLENLTEERLLQDITLRAALSDSTTALFEESTFTKSAGRRRRNADFITPSGLENVFRRSTGLSEENTFTESSERRRRNTDFITPSGLERMFSGSMGLSKKNTFTESPERRRRSADFITPSSLGNTSTPSPDFSHSTFSHSPVRRRRSADFTTCLRPSLLRQNPNSTLSGTSAVSQGFSSNTFFDQSSEGVTSAPPVTLPAWLTRQSRTDMSTAYASANTRDAAVTGRYTTYTTGSATTVGVIVREEVLDVLSEDMSYTVSDLNPFTEYIFRVSAFTTVGEGPAVDVMEKTREQVPSAVLNVTYHNISSTSILLSWAPPSAQRQNHPLHHLRAQSPPQPTPAVGEQ
ncbi:hypothetical protein WMY93_023464 [Mugilogobius chulae]|uniref:Fibronectin type-III domain-containing protein n=1 Tax=Mugilogobius chulae TaxID=88201 RepID=A0AAW0N5T8_9GOBI